MNVKNISRTVKILALVSLFTDMASEMLYPIMPLYLKSIGFSIILIGILEGLAEATAGLSKGYFGNLSDISGKRLPFVQLGYTLSALSKPLMAAFNFPIWIFFARTMDRFGKGIRTGARDAMLSAESTPETKATVFGYHRSMDTLGAVIGPAIALLYLSIFPQTYKTLFIIAFIPGMFAILATFFLREKTVKTSGPGKQISFFNFLKYWKSSPIAYKKLVGGLLLFSLFNSSDIFLLLKAKQSGLDDTFVIIVYIFYNLVYAIFALPLGILADKIGIKKVFIIGLLIFAIVYFGMAMNTNMLIFFGLFFLYGIYAAATEGIAKAWISRLTPQNETATAIGTFAGFQSLCAMLASSVTGLIWFQLGAETAFFITAAATMILVLYFINLQGPDIVKDTADKKTM